MDTVGFPVLLGHHNVLKVAKEVCCWVQVLLSGAAMSCSEEALSVVSMASTDPVFLSSRCRLPVFPPFYLSSKSGFCSRASRVSMHVVCNALKRHLSCGHRNKQEVSTEMRKQFMSPLGDHITLLNVLTSYMKVRWWVHTAL